MALLTIERVAIEPDHALSRRTLLGGLAGAAASITIGSRAFAAQGATPASGRTVETIHGPVVVPENPARIIAINFPSAVALLELGVTPVGIPNYHPAFPEGHATADGAEVIQTSTGEIDFETIVRLKPDLILGSDWLDPAKQLAPYEELSAIAPTALFEWTQAAGNWEVEAEGCAEAIGRTAELDALKDAFESKAAAIKSTPPTRFHRSPGTLSALPAPTGISMDPRPRMERSPSSQESHSAQQKSKRTDISNSRWSS